MPAALFDPHTAGAYAGEIGHDLAVVLALVHGSSTAEKSRSRITVWMISRASLDGGTPPRRAHSSRNAIASGPSSWTARLTATISSAGRLGMSAALPRDRFR
ncbi:MAG: hypothetical protein AB7H90_00985 [Alphaproteobacteria bacterium]